MTAVALDLLQAVAAAGGIIRLEGDMLRLSAPAPLPDDLRARVRQHRAEIVTLLAAAEQANSPSPEAPAAGSVALLPQEIADGVRSILSADGAQGIPPQHWTRVRRDTARLVGGGWLERALSRAWTAADLFGCDQRAPWHRLDRAGLVLLTGGHEVVDLDADAAALRTSTGSILRFRRRPVATPPVALLWDLLIPARATGPPVRALTADLSKERMAATFLAGPRRHPDQDHPSEADHGCSDSARRARRGKSYLGAGAGIGGG
jgi:hypothetical protein